MKKIMLMTDVEGVAGVLNAKDWIYPESRYYDLAKELLTEEVNAAVRGFLSGGFDDVVAVDGHGHGALNPARLHPEARLLRGPTTPIWPFGLDRSYDAYAIVGQHAKSRTPYSHLTHTGCFGTLSIAINGYEIGEYGQMALCAAELDIPTIFAAGEKAFCTEAEEITPGVITVAVKEGLNPDGCDDLSAEEYADAKLGAIHLAPTKACELIERGAKLAAEHFFHTPERFLYRDFRPPYELILKKRAIGEQPPTDYRKSHATSFIALMNQPYQEIGKE